MTEERIDIPLADIRIEPPTIVERNSDTNKYLNPYINSSLSAEIEPHTIHTSTTEIFDGINLITEMNSSRESSYQSDLVIHLEEIKNRAKDEKYVKQMENILLSHESTHRYAEVRTGLSIADIRLDDNSELTIEQKKEINRIRQRIKTYDEIGAILSSTRLNQGESRQASLDVNYIAAVGVLTSYLGKDTDEFNENIDTLFNAMSDQTGKYRDVFNFSSHVLAYMSIANGDLDYVTKCQTGKITRSKFAEDIQQTVERYVKNSEDTFKHLEDDQFFVSNDMKLTIAVNQSKKFLG